jgi:NifU-like protein involved in Fe-S cluster formation
MAANDPYNTEVRTRFAKPVYAGEVEGHYDTLLGAEAAQAGSGAWIRLTAGVEAGRVAVLKFRAWGCPHLVAAADALCEEAGGRTLGELAGWQGAPLAERLGLPRSKAGVMFILEDALRSIVAQSTKTK